MTRQEIRLGVLAAVGAVMALAVTLAAIGLGRAAAYFETPSELLARTPEPGRAATIGGVVSPGSVVRAEGQVAFRLADDEAALPVRFDFARAKQRLPDLFREGQCVIAHGALAPDGVFEARQVLAKHDESYVPVEISRAPRLAKSCGPAGRGEAGLSADEAAG